MMNIYEESTINFWIWKTKKPTQVYKEMILKDEANAPRDLQQLRDV
jgi:hypothetical protein